eukprot:CAMPEP_0196718206 /NCGR_PEP_ID=MMETSP1091-20130531/1481_1 /TAXON_ID=302021 /ORGANISM="Rhodomonas sp., Strain CCMP768" /LENGTH=219 /DNA_ID=CAMNT_0042058817 /DNA_START=13 /DNA_END=669 /DNA_ORIENTATION=-
MKNAALRKCLTVEVVTMEKAQNRELALEFVATVTAPTSDLETNVTPRALYQAFQTCCPSAVRFSERDASDGLTSSEFNDLLKKKNFAKGEPSCGDFALENIRWRDPLDCEDLALLSNGRRNLELLVCSDEEIANEEEFLACLLELELDCDCSTPATVSRSRSPSPEPAQRKRCLEQDDLDAEVFSAALYQNLKRQKLHSCETSTEEQERLRGIATSMNW